VDILDDLLEFGNAKRVGTGMEYRMAVRADRAQISNRINLIFATACRNWLQVVNMNVTRKFLTIRFAKRKSADGA
jgi:hypothetical protein